LPVLLGSFRESTVFLIEFDLFDDVLVPGPDAVL
jgi:hypothetical protein